MSLRRAPAALTAIAVLVLVWGSTWSVIRVGLEGLPPMTGISVRFAIAAAILLALARWRGVPLGRSRIERRLWWINGLFSFAISYGVVYWAEQWIPSALAAVLFATFPLCVALIAHVWLPGERLTPIGLVGILIGLAGVVCIFAGDLTFVDGPMAVTGALVMLISPISAAGASVAVKRYGAGIHPLSLTAVPMAICAAITGALALVFERDATLLWSTQTVAALIYLAVAGSAVTFTLYFWLLGFVPVTRLSLITYGVPVVAVGIGVTWMGETLGVSTLLGALLILLGVAVTLGRPEPRTTQPGSAD